MTSCHSLRTIQRQIESWNTKNLATLIRWIEQIPEMKYRQGILADGVPCAPEFAERLAKIEAYAWTVDSKGMCLCSLGRGMVLHIDEVEKDAAADQEMADADRAGSQGGMF